jgi:uncharacterized protein
MIKSQCLKLLLIILALAGLFLSCQKISRSDYPFTPVSFKAVKLTDNFWAPRIETNRTVTIPYAFKLCQETGRITNFEIAGGLKQGSFCTKYPFDDSDVYKIIEGAAYSLSVHPDPDLEKYVDDIIAKIAKAQEPDGYIYTARTIDPQHLPVDWVGKERWSNEYMSHELYNAGHLYEAAVAYCQGTGKKNLLDVALKSADLISGVFGPGKKHVAPGHQEVEIGLVKLYRLTGRKKYLALAKFFLDERGNAKGHNLYGEYSQDHKPVIEQSEAVGHAVRATYMYSGMADVAALTGNKAYIQAIDRIWENVVFKKMYVTGGIGAAGGIEGFGADYELPNAEAYCETCAAIGNILWNQRMFLLHGDAKYIDVMERVLYNGFLSGISLSGDQFFYPNPLESFGQYRRSAWFNCACCPSNITRFIPSIPGYIYAKRADSLYVNLFAAGEADIELAEQKVNIRQESQYPWDGNIKITLDPGRSAEFAVHIRIPGWAVGQPVPGDLYHFQNKGADGVAILVNGAEIPLDPSQGYVRIQRAWKPGDVIEAIFPMPIRRILANPAVKDDVGKAALERGPLVYCAEWPDNGGRVSNLVLEAKAPLDAERRDNLLNGVTVIKGEATALYEGKKGGPAIAKKQQFLAIPYYAWAHRGEGEMAVWLAREASGARPLPNPSLASKSKPSASGGKNADSLKDQWDPTTSNDHAHPYLHWWPNKGTQEWVQYDFDMPAIVEAVDVYWFDDTGQGECRVPASWRAFYQAGNAWTPVQNLGPYGVEKDRYNKVKFRPVRTKALRLEIQLQKDFSAGILEWRVE